MAKYILKNVLQILTAAVQSAAVATSNGYYSLGFCK